MPFKNFAFLLSLSTALCMPAFSQAANLSESVRHALVSHPQMKAGAASRTAADKNVWEQGSAFFPTLSVEGGAGRAHNNDMTTRANTPGGGGAYTPLGQGTVTLTQPIFSGFSSLNRLYGARDRYAAADDDLRSTAEEIALRAARAHLNLMRTRELLDQAGVFLTDIENRRKSIALMVKAGAADQAQLLQADEIQASARNTKLGYEEAFRQAEADYIEVVGEAPDTKLEFGDTTWNALIPATLEDAVAHAASTNPHVQSANKISDAMKRETSAEKASLIPHVDAVMSYAKTGQNSLVGGNVDDTQAMIKLGWSFSTGGGEFARIGKSVAQEAEAAARREDAIRTVEHDVRQKYTSMQIVDQQFSLLSDREDVSKKVFKNFVSQFEAGKQTNLQLVAARLKVFEASAALTDTRYRQLLSRFELLNAMGKLRESLGADKTGIGQKG